MSYKPKFCCQCGEKIERIDWKPWNSRRFCELCETEFGIHDWAVRLIVLGGLLFGIIGFGSYWQKSDKPLTVARNHINTASANLNNSTVKQNAVTDANSNRSERNSQNFQAVNSTQQTKQINVSPQNLITKKNTEVLVETSEAVYYCGAQTKKGTPCSRRVKGGGRCWQHVGQAAMLPQQKLIVSQ